MAQSSYALVGAHGVKSVGNMVTLGDLDAWMDAQINQRLNGNNGIDRYYQLVPWMYRGVMLRSKAIASMPFEILQGETVIDSSDDYQNVLEFLPEPEKLFWLMEASLTLTGTAYILPQANRFAQARNTQSGLKYVAPMTIKPVYNQKTGELTGYIRTVNGRIINLTLDEVMAFWYPDPFVEMGVPQHFPAQAAVLASSVLLNLDAFVAAFFERGAIKTTLVALEGATDQKERERFKETWKKAMQGVKNAWDSLVVNAKAVTATTIGEGVKDLQNTELSQGKREDIAAALSIPYTKLFSGSASGLGGGGVADADDARWYNEFVIPDCTFVANQFNKSKLFMDNDWRVRFMFETIDVLQVDETERAQAALALNTMINDCSIYEQFEFVQKQLGMEYDEQLAKAMYAMKDQKAQEEFDRQQQGAMDLQTVRGAQLADKEKEKQQFQKSMAQKAQITAALAQMRVAVQELRAGAE